jgi:TPR repeat protein
MVTFVDEESQASASMGVIPENAATAPSTAQRLEKIETSLPEHCPHAEIKKRGPSTLGGISGAFLLVHCTTSNGGVETMKFAVATKPGLLLVFDSVSPDPNYQAVLPALNLMEHSLKLLAPVEPAARYDVKVQPASADSSDARQPRSNEQGASSPTTPAEIRVAATKGNTVAQYELGLDYYNGEGVLQDDQQAALWFRKSAEQGYAEAQYNLAHMYAHGKGVPQDDRQAISWYRKAAEQGIVEAEYNLGLMLSNNSPARDLAQAAMWFRKAADRGYVEAESGLGLMYE